MLLSILTPLYNRDWCIADCIASTGLAAVPEAGIAAEMIVVDDGSRDGSVARVRAAAAGLGGRLRLIEQANAGPSAARNRGAAEAQGDWLVFLDSDDLWFPWTLETLAQTLAALPEAVDLAFLAGRNFADPADLRGITDGPATRPAGVEVPGGFLETVRRNPGWRYGACNAAIRRRAFQSLGGFAPELRCAEDTDLFLRVAGPVALIRAPVLAALRRSGQDSLTGNAREVARGFAWLSAHRDKGRYAGQGRDLRDFIAGSCAHAIRTAFATGHIGLAYGLYLRNLGLLTSPRTRRHLTRLPLTPLLHLMKPAAFPFRWRTGRG